MCLLVRLGQQGELPLLPRESMEVPLQLCAHMYRLPFLGDWTGCQWELSLAPPAALGPLCVFCSVFRKVFCIQVM